MAEFLIGVIALGVIFMGFLLVVDLSRARMNGILEARKDAGPLALAGLISGEPTYHGSADSITRLASDVLDTADHPIAYSQYAGPTAPYITENLTAPLYNSSATFIGNFLFTANEKTFYVTNSAFLQEMGVGRSLIPVTEKVCLPLMKDFQ